MTQRWIVLALAASLAGCNLAPTYERAAPPVPAQLPQGASYPTLDVEASKVETVGWHRFFLAPGLQEVIALALANNRDLRVTVANVEQARALYGVQRAAQFPSIAADAGLNARNTGEGGNGTQRTYSVGAGVSAFELDLFGRMRNLSAAALEQYLASEATQQSARISLVAETANAYVALASAQEQLRIARQAVEARKRVLELTRARQLNGVASGLDTRQANTSYEQARADVALYTTNVAQARNALDLLAGAPVPEALLPEGLPKGTFVLDKLPVGLASEVLLARPDVRSAEHQLIAQHANIGAARAAFFPSVSLTAALGTASGALSGLFGAGSRSWSFVPGLTQMVFDGGAARSNLDYAKASRDAAVATYEKSIQSAFREVADALARRGTIADQLQAQQAVADTAADTLRIAEERYRTGADTFLNVLTAQQTLLSAQVGLTSLLATREANMIELYRALGGGLVE